VFVAMASAGPYWIPVHGAAAEGGDTGAADSAGGGGGGAGEGGGGEGEGGGEGAADGREGVGGGGHVAFTGGDGAGWRSCSHQKCCWTLHGTPVVLTSAR